MLGSEWKILRFARLTRSLATGLLIFVCACVSSSADDRIPMIDAHSQIDHLADLNKVIPLMDKAGIARVILTTRGKRRLSDIVALANRHPKRITASIRLKGRKYEQNDPGFQKQLRKRLKNPTFGAMAEALIFHAQKGTRAGRVALDFSAPQVRSAFAAADRKRWPFIVHIEFASAGDLYQKYLRSLENFLRRHSGVPIALIHMGQLGVDQVARLIGAHPNVYFLTSHANTIVRERSRQPWVDLFAGRELAPAWRKLMISHPERFILAFDNVWAEHWGDYYVRQAHLWQDVLSALPPDVAHAIAHKNAERLWRLSPAK